MVDAKKVRDMAAKKANQFMGQVSGKVPPHKHCRICQEPIPVSAEPRVCKDQTCIDKNARDENCLLYTSPSPRDISGSRMPSSA